MTLTKRQRKILEFVREFTERRGYAPTLAEIGKHFGLSSPATVHKHLRNLEERGALKRRWNHSRAIEILPEEGTSKAYELPLVGVLSAGRPVEYRTVSERVPVPPGLVGVGTTYVLQVRGDGFREECVRDGDLVVIEETEEPPEGAMVLARLASREAVLRTFRRQGGGRPQPGGAAGSADLGDAGDVRVQGKVVGVLRKY